MHYLKTALFSLLGVLIFASFLFGQDKKTSDGEAGWENGILKLRSKDGKFMTRFDVRMYINGAYFFEDKNEMSNGTHLRKARFAMKTKLWEVWRAEWDIDIAEGEVETKDMYVSYTGFNNSHIKLGHFKMPLGLNELTSSRYQTFVERAYPMMAFETDRRVGLEYSTWGNNYNLRAAVYGQSMDVVKNKTKDETGNGVAARFVYAPLRTEDLTVHAGLAGVYQLPDDENNAIEIKSEPETKIGDVEILDTGTIFDVDYFTKAGLEGAAAYKNFSVQGEYVRMDVMRSGINPVNDQANKDAMFDGGYVFASWILTGESRPWDETQGEFGQIIPNCNKLGAWEVALRYSHLNLSDTNAGILGGMANNFTLGVNWYPNPNIRFMLNYTMVQNSEHATGDGFIGGDKFSVLHALVMVYF